jgi:hypothetical protein
MHFEIQHVIVLCWIAASCNDGLHLQQCHDHLLELDEGHVLSSQFCCWRAPLLHEWCMPMRGALDAEKHLLFLWHCWLLNTPLLKRSWA